MLLPLYYFSPSLSLFPLDFVVNHIPQLKLIFLSSKPILHIAWLFWCNKVHLQNVQYPMRLHRTPSPTTPGWWKRTMINGNVNYCFTNLEIAFHVGGFCNHNDGSLVQPLCHPHRLGFPFMLLILNFSALPEEVLQTIHIFSYYILSLSPLSWIYYSQAVQSYACSFRRKSMF